MFLPALICLGTPFVIGLLFGTTALAGVLPGILVSGVAMAVSYANAGGAWDNAKKYIEGGYYKERGVVVGKGTDLHKVILNILLGCCYW